MKTIDMFSLRRRTIAALFLASAASAALLGCGGGSDNATFHATWGSAQQSALEVIPGFPAPEAVSFNDQTVRMTMRMSIGGAQVRVRVSNVVGTAPLVISAAHIARRAGDGAISAATDRALTFSGNTSITLAPGAELDSDPVDLVVAAQDDLSVSVYYGSATPVVTQHSLGRQNAYVVAGNQVAAASIATTDARQSYFNLAAIEVLNSDRTNVVVTFGDSITDGFASTVDANRRWPNDFAARLASDPGAGVVAVVNTGISGNRILNDAVGPKALDRFERDVIERTGVTHVIMLIGINDIGFAGFIPTQAPTVEQITTALQSMIDRAKARNIKVYVSTLTPFKGTNPPYYSDAAEANRVAYNAFVRANKTIDGLIDFEAALRDPSDPTRMLAAYDSGDQLHPNDAGYQAMADAIDTSRFKVAP